MEIVAEPYISADPCHLGIYSYFYLLQILSKIYWNCILDKDISTLFQKIKTSSPRYGGSLFDNCLLSDSRIDGFGRYNSLESKLDWTVYRMNPYCNDNGGGRGKN